MYPTAVELASLVEDEGSQDVKRARWTDSLARAAHE